MSTPVAQPNSGWQVIGQSPDTDISTPGVIVDGVRVSFRTGNGVTDSVFVPNDRYHDLDYVSSLIAAKVRQHDLVANLGQTGR